MDIAFYLIPDTIALFKITFKLKKGPIVKIHNKGKGAAFLILVLASSVSPGVVWGDGGDVDVDSARYNKVASPEVTTAGKPELTEFQKKFQEALMKRIRSSQSDASSDASMSQITTPKPIVDTPVENNSAQSSSQSSSSQTVASPAQSLADRLGNVLRNKIEKNSSEPVSWGVPGDNRGDNRTTPGQSKDSSRSSNLANRLGNVLRNKIEAIEKDSSVPVSSGKRKSSALAPVALSDDGHRNDDDIFNFFLDDLESNMLERVRKKIKENKQKTNDFEKEMEEIKLQLAALDKADSEDKANAKKIKNDIVVLTTQLGDVQSKLSNMKQEQEDLGKAKSAFIDAQRQFQGWLFDEGVWGSNKGGKGKELYLTLQELEKARNELGRLQGEEQAASNRLNEHAKTLAYMKTAVPAKQKDFARTKRLKNEALKQSNEAKEKLEETEKNLQRKKTEFETMEERLKKLKQEEASLATDVGKVKENKGNSVDADKLLLDYSTAYIKNIDRLLAMSPQESSSLDPYSREPSELSKKQNLLHKQIGRLAVLKTELQQGGVGSADWLADWLKKLKESIKEGETDVEGGRAVRDYFRRSFETYQTWRKDRENDPAWYGKDKRDFLERWRSAQDDFNSAQKELEAKELALISNRHVLNFVRSMSSLDPKEIEGRVQEDIDDLEQETERLSKEIEELQNKIVDAKNAKESLTKKSSNRAYSAWESPKNYDSIWGNLFIAEKNNEIQALKQVIETWEQNLSIGRKEIADLEVEKQAQEAEKVEKETKAKEAETKDQEAGNSLKQLEQERDRARRELSEEKAGLDALKAQQVTQAAKIAGLEVEKQDQEAKKVEEEQKLNELEEEQKRLEESCSPEKNQVLQDQYDQLYSAIEQKKAELEQWRNVRYSVFSDRYNQTTVLWAERDKKREENNPWKWSSELLDLEYQEEALKREMENSEKKREKRGEKKREKSDLWLKNRPKKEALEKLWHNNALKNQEQRKKL